MTPEQALREKLRKIEALFAGAATEGERVAAGAAADRIRERLDQAAGKEKEIEMKFSISDVWSRQLFIALCRRYGIRPFRYRRMHRQSIIIRAPKSFVEQVLWPEFGELSAALTAYLSEITEKVTVRCEQRDIDRYKRIVAVCRLGGVDLNAWMVRQGWAIAYRQYSRDYVGDESTAQAEKAGIWAGRFIDPSRWRRGDRLAVESAKEPAATSCQIKGNISRSGERIYHVPGGRDYGPTRIDESKGERWFCSEDEARKAGWRRSVR